jgi:hypothetical protein
MIDVNATTIVVGMMCTIVMVGFGFWLNSLLSANKQKKSNKEELDETRCMKRGFAG